MYKIFEVPANSAESSEQLGTKFKIWYRDPDYGQMLVKEGRPGTGENWAEKIACELAGELGIPHAHYEFATYQDKQGVVTRMLVERGARLIHGNELLTSYAIDYDSEQSKIYRRRNHTLRRVLGYFRRSTNLIGAPYGFKRTEHIKDALDVFIGYLMFDAWIANQDRHDENWGLLRAADGNSFLSPSYDHGSSMGRNESTEKMLNMLVTKDKNQHISKYVLSARSALYPHAGDERVKAVTTIEAFSQAAKLRPDAAEEWRTRLRQIIPKAVEEIIAKVPLHLMPEPARAFTKELLRINRERILDCEI